MIRRKIERRLLSVQTALRIESLKWARNGTLQLNCHLFPLILTLKYSEFCLYPSRFLFLAGKPHVFFLSLLLLKKKHTVFSNHLMYGTFLQCLPGCQGTFISFTLFLMNDSVFVSHKVCKRFETKGIHLRRSRSQNRKRGRKSAYDLVKVQIRSRKRSHKRNGIGVRRIRTFPFSSGPGCSKVGKYYPPDKSLSSGQILQKQIALFAG